MISYEDFKRVFQSPEDGDMESKTVGAVGASTIETVQPKPIPELVDMIKVRLIIAVLLMRYRFLNLSNFFYSTEYWSRRSCSYH